TISSYAHGRLLPRAFRPPAFADSAPVKPRLPNLQSRRPLLRALYTHVSIICCSYSFLKGGHHAQYFESPGKVDRPRKLPPPPEESLTNRASVEKDSTGGLLLKVDPKRRLHNARRTRTYRGSKSSIRLLINRRANISQRTC